MRYANLARVLLTFAIIMGISPLLLAEATVERDRSVPPMIQACDALTKLAQLSASHKEREVSKHLGLEIGAVCHEKLGSRTLGIIAMSCAAITYSARNGERNLDSVFDYANARCVVLLSSRVDRDAQEALVGLHATLMSDGGAAEIIEEAINRQRRLLRDAAR